MIRNNYFWNTYYFILDFHNLLLYFNTHLFKKDIFIIYFEEINDFRYILAIVFSKQAILTALQLAIFYCENLYFKYLQYGKSHLFLDNFFILTSLYFLQK